jgi:hypothetical protein
MSRLNLLPKLFLLKRLPALALACALPLAAGHAAEPPAADAYRLSGPATHGNLAVYFVHGESRPGPAPLTLHEALTKQTVEVRETGNVNELQVMNTGDEGVYLQSGDIVKGGRQDRVLLVSMLLSPGSGVVPIPVFCVEQGRWSGRAGESSTKFESASAMLPSRSAKMAMRSAGPDADRDAERDLANARRRSERSAERGSNNRDEGVDSIHARQREVWRGVAAIQGGLSSSLGTQVESARSRSSLQLALENGDLGARQTEFVTGLEKSADADADIIGYVVAINGKLNSAEIYPSNGLFRKMWPTLLRASATEAIMDRDGESRALPSTGEVMAFLNDAQAAHGADEAAGPTAKVNVRKSAGAAMFESRPAAAAPAQWINRSYLAR